MAKFKVVVTDYVFPNLDIEKSIFEPYDVELVAMQCKSADELMPFVVDADILLNTYLGGIDRRLFSIMKKCKLIVRYGIGVDTIDINGATEYGIMVANVPDYCLDEVSDHAIACMLALTRKLTLSDRRVRNGLWDLGYLKPMRKISNLTVGVVGMGRIGRLSAGKVSAFGARIIFSDPYVNEDSLDISAKKVTLNELVASSDVILIHAPATPETHHLFDSNLFALMQRNPVIINCARGNLIDTNALVEALSKGIVSGAALDVIEGVPPFSPDHPLCRFENVIITPHSAWYSEEALINLQRLAAEEAARVLRGEKPRSLLNPEVLSKDV